MATEPSFEELMLRVRAGEESAATLVFHRFAQRLIALARSRLDPAIRKKVDPEEVIQSVYKSFFVRFMDGQFSLDSWDDLWALLTVLTVRKRGHKVEYFRAARRDVQRELTPPPLPEDVRATVQAVAREPTPDEAIALTETVVELLRPSVTLILQGHKPAEVASQCACTQRTVQRVLKTVKNWLQQRHLASAATLFLLSPTAALPHFLQ